MKIKGVILQTGLTDRAIRLYIDNGLVSPAFSENYKGRKSIDFSEDDVESLKNVATLRKAGFSIAEIKSLSEGDDECKNIISGFIERTAEKIESETEILNCLRKVITQDEINIHIICSSLNQPTAQKEVPEEDSKMTFEGFEKAIFLFVGSISLVATLIYNVVLAFHYNSEYLYPHICLINFLLKTIPMVITVICSAYLISVYKKENKKLSQRIKQWICCILVCVISLLGYLLASFPFNFTPEVYSETASAENYLKIDDFTRGYYIDEIHDLFPASIPRSAVSEDSRWYPPDKFPETTKYYYKNHLCIGIDDTDIFAQWVLPDDEFEAEKQRIVNSGKVTRQELAGSWNCIYYDYYYGDDADETGTVLYVVMFAYNDKTNAVRYIISNNFDSEPYYLSLDWS